PPRNTAYLDSKAGDVLKVRIEELRPTQAAIGYDQVYYKLGRWQGDL
ncbi:ParB-like protein, partial [Alcaligenes faecalis]